MSKVMYTYQNFKNQIYNTWQKFANKTAVVRLEEYGDRTSLRYAQLLDIAEQIARLLSDSRLGRAYRIAVITPYSAQAVVLNLALAYGGYTAVLIDAALPPDERNRLLEYADVSAVFTIEDIYRGIDKSLLESMPAFMIKEDFGFARFPDSVHTVTKTIAEPLNENVIAILFSSGTTGTMKGVQITYHSIMSAWKYMQTYANLDSNVRFLDVLPANHITGYSSTISCSMTGTELGFISQVNAQQLLQGFQTYNPTHFIMIPKIYEVIMQKIQDAIAKKPAPVRWYANFAMSLSGRVRKATGVKMRFLTKPIWKAALGKNMVLCGCGAAPCSEETAQFYLNIGMNFLNVYGSTETGFPITAANCNDKYPVQGTGNIKQFPEISVIIDHPDSNGIGEIRVKTPLIMGGYYKELELTAESFDENGYFKTGDSGYIDNDGYLYVTGRLKESIVLQSGKKVSPADVDNYYTAKVPGYDIASKGISVKNGQYDEVHLFLAVKELSEAQQQDAIAAFTQASHAAPSIYKIAAIHCIPLIPKTTVGKVKRFCLEIPKETSNMNAIAVPKSDSENPAEMVYSQIRTIARLNDDFVLNDDMRLKEDIGMDSLGILELCVTLEEAFGVSVESQLNENMTVGSLIQAVQKKNAATESTVNTSAYPLKRTEKDYQFIERFHWVSRRLWNCEVSGLEHINADQQYIFCPNHESLFDGMWIIGFLESKIRRNICSLAAEYLFEKKVLRRGIVGMGGIPVHRQGNTAPAMKRAAECLKSGSSLLIHPEGTRSRTGQFLEFKQGAAKLSIDSGISIIPVCIDGAYEIFPPQRKLPRLFDWKSFKKLALRISFGDPIVPNGKTSAELTAEIKERVAEMKRKSREKSDF